jgi:E3 ubiquitin-protein ligase Topors
VRGGRRSSPPLGRAGRQRARDKGSRYDDRMDHSPERTGRHASLSRDRDREERRDKRAPAHQRDEQRRKDKGKDSRRVDTPTPSRSPSLLSVKDDLAGAGPSNTTITEKGKQRADIGGDAAVTDVQHSLRTRSVAHDHSPHTLAPTDTQKLLDNNLQTTDKAKIDHQTETETQPVTSKRKLRPNRNQGILQAVQAHLGSSINPNGSGQQSRVRTDGAAAVKAKAAEAMDKQDGAAPGNAPDRTSNLGSSVENKPSLLARLSDRLPTSSSAVDSDILDIQPQAPEDLDVKGTKPRLSAPEIMARTRARLAKLKNEPVAGVLPTASEQLDGGHDDRSGEAGAGKHPSQPFSDDDIRTRLLNRLEEEKRQITLPAEEASPHSALSPADTSRDSRAESDSQAAEAKLRMQAQVRVRLAAAKRVTVGHVPDEASESRDVQMHETGQGARKDFGQREESLRATLRERRI